MKEHFLDGSVTQPFWDSGVEPRLVIASGDTVTFDCPEPCGQVTPDWNDDDLANISFDPIHALVGSVYVEGAEPGFSLQVEVVKMENKKWGWSGHLKGFGLLADDFDFAYIHHWELDDQTCRFGVKDIRVPFEPFCGTMGVAPAEGGRVDTISPRANGGNIDICHLTPGSTVWFPVLREGALFACGDCHSAQGSGEVCGTGVESPMLATLRFTLRKDISVREFQFETRSPLTKRDTKGFHATTGHGPDLMENSKNAVRQMIEWVVGKYGVTRSQAYLLCSTAMDLQISEIVDAPNWIVSAYMPLGIFPG